MNEALKKIKGELASLNLIAETPRLYVSNFFSNLRNEIDLSCASFICGNEAEMNDAPRAQEIMINKVNFYEEKCLDELRIDSETCKYLEKIIETIKERLNDTVWIEVYAKASDVSELDKMAYETLCKIEKRLFLGRSFVFLKKNLFQNCEIETFGKLLIVQDEFIGKRAIQKLQ